MTEKLTYKIIGVCGCGLIITGFSRFAFARVEVPADIYVPGIYAILSITSGIAVLIEKPWGYYAALALTGFQLFGFVYSTSVSLPDHIGINLYLALNNVAVLASFVTSLLLVSNLQRAPKISESRSDGVPANRRVEASGRSEPSHK